MSISIITPTADRPIGFALCERFMRRQTLQPDQWVVADGGQTPARCTMGQTHIHQPSPPGAANFCRNLLAGIEAATGDVCVFIEDDDHIAPTHIETIVSALDRPGALIAGCYPSHYYHVGRRLYRTMRTDDHSSLCMTAIRAGAKHVLRAVLEQCLADKTFAVDIALWKAIARAQQAQQARIDAVTVVGIKGLPGVHGLGIGHRPTGLAWRADPEMAQLRAWIGGDADVYAEFGRR